MDDEAEVIEMDDEEEAEKKEEAEEAAKDDEKEQVPTSPSSGDVYLYVCTCFVWKTCTNMDEYMW